MKVEQKCGIISRTMLNDAAISLTLEAGDMVRTAFRAPGQFVHIKCGHSRLLRRPISVCSCQAGEGDAPDRLTVVFEVRGEGTAWLAGRREGQSLDVMGLLKVTAQKFSQTIVMITHNEELAQMADRIIRIEDGRIVVRG